MTPRPHKLRPMPANFAKAAAKRSRKKLKAYYSAGQNVVDRWLREAGLEAPKSREPIPVPADFAAIAPTMPKRALERHYGRSGQTIARFFRESGAMAYVADTKPKPAPMPRTRPPVAGHFVIHTGTAATAPAPKSGREEEAAQFLRRHFPCVCHCSSSGRADPQGKFWLCGLAVLTPAELVERAERKGWDPDQWRRVA